MNLHGVVGPLVSAVNPKIRALYNKNIGYVTTADGVRVPSYAPVQFVDIQKQPISYKDLAQIEGLNLAGEKCVIYASTELKSVDRATNSGGDLLTFNDGSVWLVVMPLEDFFATAGWVKVAAVKQTGS